MFNPEKVRRGFHSRLSALSATGATITLVSECFLARITLEAREVCFYNRVFGLGSQLVLCQTADFESQWLDPTQAEIGQSEVRIVTDH